MALYSDIKSKMKSSRRRCQRRQHFDLELELEPVAEAKQEAVCVLAVTGHDPVHDKPYREVRIEGDVTQGRRYRHDA